MATCSSFLKKIPVIAILEKQTRISGRFRFGSTAKLHGSKHPGGTSASSGKTRLSMISTDEATLTTDKKKDYILWRSGQTDSKFRDGSVQDMKVLNVSSKFKHAYVKNQEANYEELLNNKSQQQCVAESSSLENSIQKEASQANIIAIKFLSRGPLTSEELRKKLIGKSFRSCIVEIVLSDLQQCGLQSDIQYAECFASSRWKRLSWGPMRIRQALEQKGIDEKIIGKALCEVFLDADVSKDEDQEFETGTWCMTRHSIEHLLSQARKQWSRGGDITEETRKRRLIGWLQRRGFNWKIITQVLKSLETTKQDSMKLDPGEG